MPLRARVSVISRACVTRCPDPLFVTEAACLRTDESPSLAAPPQPFNHAFFLAADTSRHIRAVDIYNEAVKLAEEASASGDHRLMNKLPPPPPPCQDVLAQTLYESQYYSKYSTKVDNLDLSSGVISAVETLFPHVRRVTDPLPEDPLKSARHNISTLLMKQFGMTSFSSQYMSLVLMGSDDHIMSHDTAPFFADAFQRRCGESLITASN